MQKPPEHTHPHGCCLHTLTVTLPHRAALIVPGTRLQALLLPLICMLLPSLTQGWSPPPKSCTRASHSCCWSFIMCAEHGHLHTYRHKCGHRFCHTCCCGECVLQGLKEGWQCTAPRGSAVGMREAVLCQQLKYLHYRGHTAVTFACVGSGSNCYGRKAMFPMMPLSSQSALLGRHHCGMRCCIHFMGVARLSDTRHVWLQVERVVSQLILSGRVLRPSLGVQVRQHAAARAACEAIH